MGVRLRRFEFRRLEFELPSWLQSELLLLGLPRRQRCEQLLGNRRGCCWELPSWLQSELLLLGLPRRQHCEQL